MYSINTVPSFSPNFTWLWLGFAYKHTSLHIKCQHNCISFHSYFQDTRMKVPTFLIHENAIIFFFLFSKVNLFLCSLTTNTPCSFGSKRLWWRCTWVAKSAAPRHSRLLLQQTVRPPFSFSYEFKFILILNKHAPEITILV